MKHEKLIKKLIGFKWLPLLLCFIFCVAAFSACSPNISDDDGVTVTVVDGENFTVSNKTYKVKRGGNLAVKILFKSGYEFCDCNYGDYEVDFGSYVTLTLKDVQYPFRLHINARPLDIRQENYEIIYHTDDGEHGEENTFTETYSLKNHLRANTSIGKNVERDGYTLFGWNTADDGSGEHIGLGSRATVCDGEPLNLYAEWLKWNDNGEFSWTDDGNGITLLKYNGKKDVQMLVLPGKIEGKNVTRIVKGFADGVNGELLALPEHVNEVEAGAFKDCNFNSIAFFDGITEISDESFSGGQFEKWYVNAAIAPRYQNVSDFPQFADNIDRLILSQGKKKMVFFAGCSMGFGLKSAIVNSAYGSEYSIFNTGVLGGADAVVQIDCITHFLEEGDVFVHAPEEGSAYQFMAKRLVDSRIITMFEANYDLLRYTDMRVEGAFDAFCDFNAARSYLKPCSYEDTPDKYNSFGDYSFPHPDRNLSVKHSQITYTFLVNEITDASMNSLCDKYDAITKKGVTLYFSFAPINYHGLPEEDVKAKVWESFEQKIKNGLAARGYGSSVISEVEDYIFDGACFFDSDYHLGDTSAVLRTERLLNDLKKVLK